MSRRKKTIVHVNQAVIKANRKSGRRDPVITVKTYDSNLYGHEVVIYNDDGQEVCRIIYRPDKPLPCGAVVWLECFGKVTVINNADHFANLPSSNEVSLDV